jgi:hypothetical protein
MKKFVRRFLIFSAIALPLSLALFLFINLTWGIDDAYAKWGAADMVIDYMRAHEGRWPPVGRRCGPF